MCRIYGYIGNKRITPEVIKQVAMQQIQGGPDAQAFKRGEDWTLGNNRLAIQDVNAGHQPFYANQIYAVYNGEIYNHVELKKTLALKGYKFSDHCDGSVIIPLYEEYGEDFVKYLDGMFAIAIIDTRLKSKLILATDPGSIKSLFVYFDDSSDTYYFSSELSSLFIFPIKKNLRPEAVDEYLIGRALWHGKTFFADIHELTPRTIIVKEMGQAPRKAFYDSYVTEKYNQADIFEKTADYLDYLINAEVKQMVKADVPVCMVTSGGLDSSYLSAIASKYVSQLACFNIAYEGDWPADERSYAQEVAKACGIEYNQILISEREFPEILDKTIQHLGQPNSAPHALSTYALFKAIKERGFKVAIAGEGADEFFGGYERFRKAMLSTDENWLHSYFDIMCATTHSSRQDIYSDEYKQFLLHNQYHLLNDAKICILQNAERLQSRLKSLLYFDQTERFPHYILRRVDHLAMANSVEVRVPFCQPKIINYARNLPDDFLIDNSAVKKILYKAAANTVPTSVLTRPKQPFTLPITAMLKKGHVLFDIMYDTLHSISFQTRGFFNSKQIQIFLEQQLKTPNDKIANVLWSVMILELWLKRSSINAS